MMAYIKLEEANVTTLDKSRSNDPAVVVVKHRGEDIFTLSACVTNELAREVGRAYTAHNDELWLALTPEYIRECGAADRAAAVSDSALRAAGWDI